MISKEQANNIQLNSNASEEIIYRIEIPANRYDLLCLEGLVKAFLIYQGKLVKQLKLETFFKLPLISESTLQYLKLLNQKKEILNNY